MDSESPKKLDNTVNLAEEFAFSGRFKTLFRDGMTLVEESAAYLDGAGREAAKTLDRTLVTLYGTESMRLTTRLMQLASWLLLQRAANEGEMTSEQFLEEKKKVKLETLPVSNINDGWNGLPPEFTALVSRSLTLQNRILAIDAEVYARGNAPAKSRTENPVSQQLNLLSTALGVSRRLN
jgi:regulator of CtrA degradation